MARNIQFSELVIDLRAELRRSGSPAVGVEDLPVLKRTLNHNYKLIHLMKDWEFLKLRKSITLNAGQRYYDIPSGIDLERIKKFKVKYGDQFLPVIRGIELDDYNIHDSDDDERSAPVLKWDFNYDADTNTPQIEFWPIPDDNAQVARIQSYAAISPLVNDTDVCLLESEIVVLYSAAELLQSVKADDAVAKRDLANEMMRLTAIHTAKSGGQSTSIGGSRPDQSSYSRATVRISS
jgi:hypothetical protein